MLFDAFKSLFRDHFIMMTNTNVAAAIRRVVAKAAHINTCIRRSFLLAQHSQTLMGFVLFWHISDKDSHQLSLLLLLLRRCRHRHSLDKFLSCLGTRDRYSGSSGVVDIVPVLYRSCKRVSNTCF